MRLASENVKKVREKLKMSQVQFANALGIARGSISYYEGGKRALTASIANKILGFAKQNGIEIEDDYFFARDNKEQEDSLVNKETELREIRKQLKSVVRRIEDFLER